MGSQNPSQQRALTEEVETARSQGARGELEGTRYWYHLVDFQSTHFRHGFPEHVDLNEVWLELTRSNVVDPRIHRHCIWRHYVHPIIPDLMRYLEAKNSGEYATWRDVPQKFPAIGSPAVLWALRVLNNVNTKSGSETSGDLPHKSDFSSIFNNLDLGWVFESPVHRIVPSFWRGADFDDAGWRLAYMMPWPKRSASNPNAWQRVDINRLLRIDYISKAKQSATVSPQAPENHFVSGGNARRDRYTSENHPLSSTTNRGMDLRYDFSPKRQVGSAKGEPEARAETEPQRAPSEQPAIKHELEPDWKDEDVEHPTKRARYGFETSASRTPARETAAEFETSGLGGVPGHAGDGLSAIKNVSTELATLRGALVDLTSTKIAERQNIHDLACAVQSFGDSIQMINVRLARIERELQRRPGSTL
ncbi:hypothetical protein B0H67DRAFT_645552 [Lasiosphaeris hirsuta]|uniref:Uncharacterized protein n=1 Tax=Lasiosphaeris hirsuta TaxID=260670 RepID=A0AA40DUB0_9PEZI|nr:hypothetical protein B0H67DRAFT_645552 [Lasiosphaeris hirsuta]